MKYSAFISYSGASRDVALRLHRELERYRVPTQLRDRTAYGEIVSKSLGSFFLDRAELSASQSLKSDIELALKESRFLIVVCSPEAAASKWVPLEIDAFKSLGREGFILPVLAEGEPVVFDDKTAPDGAFPKQLFEGRLKLENLPLAPDFRREANSREKFDDKFSDGLLRVVARLVDVPFPEVQQRQLVFERQKRRFRSRVIALLAVLLGLAVASGAAAWSQKNAADERLSQAIRSAARQVEIAAEGKDQYRVPSTFLEGFLKGASEDFNEILDYAGENPSLLLSRARYHLRMSDLAADTKGSSLARATHLRKASEDLTAAEKSLGRWYSRLVYSGSPDPSEIFRERVGAIDRAVGIAAQQQNAAEAKKLALEAIELSRSLEGLDQSGVSQHQVFGKCALADVQYQLGERREAVDLYKTCLEATQQLAKEAKNDAVEAMRIRAMIDFGMILRLDNVGEALRLHRSAVDLALPIAEAQATSNDKRELAIEALVTWTDTRNMANEPPAEQIEAYVQAKTALDDLIETDSNRTDWKLLRANVGYRLAGIQARHGYETNDAMLLENAKIELANGIDLTGPLADRFPSDARIQRMMTALLESRAEVLHLLWEFDPGEKALVSVVDDLELVVAGRKALVEMFNSSPVLQRDLANAHLTRARLLFAHPDHWGVVKDDISSAQKIFLALEKLEDFRPNIYRDLAALDFTSANFLSAKGEFDAACQAAASAKAHTEQLLDALPNNMRTLSEDASAEEMVLRLCD